MNQQTCCPATNASVTILGVRVDNVTPEEAISRISGFLQEDHPHQVVTVNPEYVVTAQKDAAFARVLHQADLAVPDGFGLLLASRWLGNPLRSRVTGVELTWRLASLAATQGYRLFLLGAAPGVAELAAKRLTEAYPSLEIAGTYAGSPHIAEEEAIVTRVRAAQAQILLVAYGAPAQDKWIARNKHRLGVRVAMGVGGVFDYLAGVVPWAPPLVRRLGLEWLYRLIHQPWRWRRIWNAVPYFTWLVLTSGHHGDGLSR